MKVSHVEGLASHSGPESCLDRFLKERCGMKNKREFKADGRSTVQQPADGV